jgi:flagellar biosynthesis/type III secretory pathway M-ring protein FliF/YscJ
MDESIVGYMVGEFAILLAAALVLYAIVSQVSRKMTEAEELKRKQRAAEGTAAGRQAPAPHGPRPGG